MYKRQMLLERGADVTCRDDRGVSALDYVIKKGLNIESATMLAKIGTEKGIMLSGMRRDQTEAKLGSQGLQPADAILIVSDLQFMAVMTTLDLIHNNIGPEGAIAIAEALKVNAVLITLRLDKNKIGPEGAMAIAEALKVNAVLTFLSLRNNNFGDAGNKVLKDALRGRSGFVLEL